MAAAEAWPLAEPLDGYLREVVMTLRQVAERGIRHVGDDSSQAERAIGECTEILGVIMHGDAQMWLATS